MSKIGGLGKGEERMLVIRWRRGSLRCRRNGKCIGRKERLFRVFGGIIRKIWGRKNLCVRDYNKGNEERFWGF